MAAIDLKVRVRESSGKSSSRKIRTQGLIPGIIYGKGGKNISISVNPSLLKKALTQGGGINTLLNLVEEESKSFGKKTVLVKDIQKEPLEFSYLHVDFYELDLKKTIEVKVPLSFVGKAAGLQAGGIVQPILREVEVRSLPHAIPPYIEVDVTPLNVGDALHMSDLKAQIQGKEYEIIFDSDDTIVTVTVPKEEVVEAPKPAEGEAPQAVKEGEAATAPAEKEPAAKEVSAPQETKKKEEGKK